MEKLLASCFPLSSWDLAREDGYRPPFGSSAASALESIAEMLAKKLPGCSYAYKVASQAALGAAHGTDVPDMDALRIMGDRIEGIDGAIFLAIAASTAPVEVFDAQPDDFDFVLRVYERLRQEAPTYVTDEYIRTVATAF